MRTVDIGSRLLGDGTPVFFVADISANHDGDLDRAKALIRLAAESGADAAKFQNFQASKIVSDRGFNALGVEMSHQSHWQRSVYDVYASASIPGGWTSELKAECDQVGIEYFSTPYDFESVDMLDEYVSLYKIGSGDITWLEMLKRVAKKGKPVLLATGAAGMADVERAVEAILAENDQLVLMQCNTNYTASEANFEHVHLNVLRTFREAFPELLLGLSDHTHGLATTLGAVVLGACVVEKHFTDDINREGPDHGFSMDSLSWSDMVARTRELERALGSRKKFVADNEKETVVVQRRCLRVTRDLQPGEVLVREDLDILRPSPAGAIQPYEIDAVIGRTVCNDILSGSQLEWRMLV